MSQQQDAAVVADDGNFRFVLRIGVGTADGLERLVFDALLHHFVVGLRAGAATVGNRRAAGGCGTANQRGGTAAQRTGKGNRQHQNGKAVLGHIHGGLLGYWGRALIDCWAGSAPDAAHFNVFLPDLAVFQAA